MEDAAYVIGKSKKTIYNHKDKNKFSHELDSEGRTVIDVSELIRVYGDKPEINTRLKELQSGDTVKKSENTSNYNDKNSGGFSKEQVELIRAQAELDKEQALRKRAEEEIEYYKSALEKAQETAQKVTLMLEDKSGEGRGDWDRAITALEKRIANQEKVAKEREDREQRLLKQSRALKKALDKEKSKSFFQKLFG